MNLASIPSPSRGQIDLGPIPLRGYALCIIIGVVIAIWLGERRWAARGGRAGTIGDIAVWAVPFGLIGGRLYHVITTPGPYFGEGGDPLQAFAVWKGGLGIWGAIALGGLGAWIACRRRGIPLPAFADAVAPGIALAQAAGRWGNWFNQELYGRATDVPWAVEIDGDHNVIDPGVAATFHPTFLYESLWCVGVAVLVVWADRRFTLGHGRAFALYVAAYTVGRFWIEYMRVDDAEQVLGMRLNNWTSILVCAGAVAYMILSARSRPGREEPALLAGTPESGTPESGTPEAGDTAASGTKGTDGADAEGADADYAADADDAAAEGTGGKPGDRKAAGPKRPGTPSTAGGTSGAGTGSTDGGSAPAGRAADPGAADGDEQGPEASTGAAGRVTEPSLGGTPAADGD